MMRLVESGRAGSRRAGSQEGDALSRIMKRIEAILGRRKRREERGGDRKRSRRGVVVAEKFRETGRAAQQGEVVAQSKLVCATRRTLTFCKRPTWRLRVSPR
jgi:hypothetical protein